MSRINSFRSISARELKFDTAFLRINPNNKIPALVDHAPRRTGASIRLFESGAIMVYLAQKYGKLCRRKTQKDLKCFNG